MRDSISNLLDTKIASPTNGQVPVYNSTTGKWENSSATVTLTGDVTGSGAGALATTIAAVNKTTVVRLGGDVSNSSNPVAWADVTGLAFAVGIGTYSFDFPLLVTTAATTTRMLCGINGPTKSFLGLAYQWQLSTGAFAFTNGIVSAYDTSATPASSTTTGMARVYGTITTTATGTLQLRFQSNVISSAVTIKQGSYGVLIG